MSAVVPELQHDSVFGVAAGPQVFHGGLALSVAGIRVSPCLKQLQTEAVIIGIHRLPERSQTGAGLGRGICAETDEL